MIERTRAAPEQATAVVAAGAPTTDVECFEAVRASRRGDAPFSADTPPERPPDAVEAEERLGTLLRKAEKAAAAAVAKDAEVAAELAKVHTCAICLDPTSVTLVCGHAMCEECMGRLAVFQGQTVTRFRRRVVIRCPLRCDAPTERVLA